MVVVDRVIGGADDLDGSAEFDGAGSNASMDGDWAAGVGGVAFGDAIGAAGRGADNHRR